MVLSILLIGLFTTVGLGIYSAWVTYINLKKEDYEVDFNKLMSRSYLNLIEDKERQRRLLKVKRWTLAFVFVLISYLFGSLFMALSMKMALFT